MRQVFHGTSDGFMPLLQKPPTPTILDDLKSLIARSNEMQTFMPYPDFGSVAKVLDTQRLGKQRVEGSQILAILLGQRWHPLTSRFVDDPAAGGGYQGHPAVRMWSGHEGSLANYILVMCAEWKRRGFVDVIANRVGDYLLPLCPDDSLDRPDWLFDDRAAMVCSSHRSVLLAKDYIHYVQFGWPEKPASRETISGRWPYVWPTRVNVDGSVRH